MTASLFSADLLSLLFGGKRNGDVKAFIARENLQSTVDRLGNNLLHYAAEWNNVAIVQDLLDSGNSVDAQNHLGKTPLMLAVENGCCEAIQILIKAGASILLENRLRNNVLEMFGVSNWLCQQANVMGILLQNCDIAEIASILVRDEWTLVRATFFRNACLTKLLLSRYKYSNDIDAKDDEFDGATALHVATRFFDVENVKLLLRYNPNIDVKDNYSQTPLKYLYKGDISKNANERFEILKMFIEYEEGEDKVARIIEIDSDIECLLEHGSKEAIKLLIEAGLDLDAKQKGPPCGGVVHVLLRNANPGVLEQLRHEPFNVNVCNNNLETPLIIAASRGMPRAVELFIDMGADMNAIDSCYRSALAAAFCNCEESEEMKYRDCVQILLERGANAQSLIVASDDEKLTILDYILQSKNFQRGELVLSHLALQEAFGTPIKQWIRDKINSNERLTEQFKSCQRELNTRVCPTLTLRDLLSASQKRFQFYMRDPELYSKVKSFIETCKFHYFKTILEKPLSKVIIKARCARIICRFMGTDYERCPLIADQIISYLKQEDMENLLRAISKV